jgi:hypothetical protein
MSWHFDWITSWEEIMSPTFQAQWLRWAEKASNSHVFFHPALGRAWLGTYRALRNLQPLFLIAKRNDTTVFLPLVIWRQNWKNACHRLLVPVGYSDYDYHDPLVINAEFPKGERLRPEAGDLEPETRQQRTSDLRGSSLPLSFWPAFERELCARWGQLFDQCEIEGIVDERMAGLTGWESGEACPFCALDRYADPLAFMQHLSPKLRNDLGRQQRRMAQQGTLQFHVYGQEEESAAVQSLESLLRFHAQRWPGAYKAPGFHRRLLAEASRAGVLHFSEVRLSGKAISWRFNYVWQGCHYSYLPIYDPEYANFSPAKVHMLFCYEDSMRRNLTVFDHTRGDEAYKSGWATGKRHVHRRAIGGRATGSKMRNWLVQSVKPRLAKRQYVSALKLQLSRF